MEKNYRKAGGLFLPGLAVFFILLIGLSGCRQESKWPGLVVNAQFSDRELTDYLVTKLKLKFITTSNFHSPEQDWKLIAEASYENRLIFREEFATTPRPPAWLPDHVYDAEKYIFIPAFIDRFSPEFSSGARISFQVFAELENKERVPLYQRMLKLKPCPPSIPDVLFLEGWQTVDGLKGNKLAGQPDLAGQAGLLTGQKATCLIKNPGRNSRLMIRGESLAPEGEQQLLVIYVEGKLLDTLRLNRGPFQKVYELSADELGQNREIKLSLVVDRIFPLEQQKEVKESGLQVGVKINTVYLRPV